MLSGRYSRCEFNILLGFLILSHNVMYPCSVSEAHIGIASDLFFPSSLHVNVYRQTHQLQRLFGLMDPYPAKRCIAPRIYDFFVIFRQQLLPNGKGFIEANHCFDAVSSLVMIRTFGGKKVRISN